MAVKLSPIFNEQEFDANGDPLVGGKLYTYAAGSSTPLASYTSSTGGTAQANPIILNSRGEVDNPIWITAGKSYKFALYDVNDVLVRTVDNVTGVNDSSVSIDQWIDSGVVPTYVSATKFTLPGDQTSSFTVHRRIKATVTAGTVYGSISVSAYTDLTTITLVLDSGELDSGLSAVQLGILTPTNSALPQVSTSQIQDLAVTTAKLQDLAVTNAKLAQQYINDLTTVTFDLTSDYVPIADASDSFNKKKALIPVSQNYLTGLTMSTAGASATLTVAAGQAANSTNATLMTIAASIAKTTAAWEVGTDKGGLDTGTIANSTWYHWYLIRRPNTGVVDVIFSKSASEPTLPADYTQYRRIGAAYTNGSGEWTKFLQFGDQFYWATPSKTASNVTVPASRENVTTLTPLGIRTVGIYNLSVSNDTNLILRLYGIDDDDLTVTADNGTLTSRVDSTRVATTKNVITDTSSKVSWRASASTAGCYLQTLGYIDNRGKG